MAPDHTHGDTTIKGNSGQTALPTQFGRYEVKKKLGNGAMGTVYLVVNTDLEREEALKVPHFVDGDDTQVRERFLREAKSAAKLEHANICPVYASGVQDGIYYMTMRYLPGNELSAYKGVAQPARKAVEIVIKLAQALEAAHSKGVIHRDLKPSNVMMVNGVGPVVMDFGLAKLVVHADQSRSHAGEIGTPAYMPPEQVNGDRELMGPASDVYSLGVILYELLTDRLPFEGTVGAVYAKILHTEPPLPSALAARLSPMLDGICGKAMAKAPTDRYTSMKAFAAALMDCYRSMPASAGAGKLTPSAADRAAIFQTPTVPPRPLPAEKAAIFQTPRLAPAAARPRPRVFEAISPGSGWSGPAAKPRKNRWLVILTRVAAVLLVIVGLGVGTVVVLYLRAQRETQRWEEDSKREEQRLSQQNFEKLRVGMTLKELDEILGQGRLAGGSADLVDGEQGLRVTYHDGVWGKERSATWQRATKAGQVQIWQRKGGYQFPFIMAAFPGSPTSESKVDVLLRGNIPTEQKPADKWLVTKDNFIKLKVGMTLNELEDIIGVGEVASSVDVNGFSDAWYQAAKGYRVYKWERGWDGKTMGSRIGPFIKAGFSAPPSASAAAKVEALNYQDGGVWDEEKGTLSRVKK